MTSERTFSCEVLAVRATRTYIEDVLGDLSPESREVVNMLVSELATNSVRYAADSFTVVVEQAGDTVRVEVADDGLGVPLVRPLDVRAERGRGLLLVEAMADDWGVSYRSHGRRKSTWFSLQVAERADRAASATSRVAPCRHGD